MTNIYTYILHFCMTYLYTSELYRKYFQVCLIFAIFFSVLAFPPAVFRCWYITDILLPIVESGRNQRYFLSLSKYSIQSNMSEKDIFAHIDFNTRVSIF